MCRVFDQPIGTFIYFFVRCENFAPYHNKRLLRADSCRSVTKEFAYAFSCTSIELWMHLGRLESTQKSHNCSRLRLELLLRIFRALQTSRVHP